MRPKAPAVSGSRGNEERLRISGSRSRQKALPFQSPLVCFALFSTVKQPGYSTKIFSYNNNIIYLHVLYTCVQLCNIVSHYLCGILYYHHSLSLAALTFLPLDIYSSISQGDDSYSDSISPNVNFNFGNTDIHAIYVRIIIDR